MADVVTRIRAALSDGRHINDAVAMDAAEEIERLRAALQAVYDHCQNEGYGNPIVDQRIVDRCEETALAALKR